MGRPPFEADGMQATYGRISSLDLHIPSFVSPRAASFIRAMLHLEASERLTPEQICEHPFIREYDRLTTEEKTQVYLFQKEELAAQQAAESGEQPMAEEMETQE